MRMLWIALSACAVAWGLSYGQDPLSVRGWGYEMEAPLAFWLMALLVLLGVLRFGLAFLFWGLRAPSFLREWLRHREQRAEQREREHFLWALALNQPHDIFRRSKNLYQKLPSSRLLYGFFYAQASKKLGNEDEVRQIFSELRQQADTTESLRRLAFLEYRLCATPLDSSLLERASEDELLAFCTHPSLSAEQTLFLFEKFLGMPQVYERWAYEAVMCLWTTSLDRKLLSKKQGESVWNRFPARWKKRSVCVLLQARFYEDLGDGQAARQVLSSHLLSGACEDERVFLAYARLGEPQGLQDQLRVLEAAEERGIKSPHAMGMVCRRAGLWKKSDMFLKKAWEQKRDPQVFFERIHLYIQTKDWEALEKICRDEI